MTGTIWLRLLSHLHKGNNMINPTHRRYPRTLAEAFPRYPEANFVDDEPDYHPALHYVLVALLVALPVLLWAL